MRQGLVAPRPRSPLRESGSPYPTVVPPSEEISSELERPRIDAAPYVKALR